MSFQTLSSQHLPDLDLTVHTFEHPSGLRHIHLASHDAELGFTVAFPTLPQTNDGRAHVLEHTVLCGSQRYPVRDPFFAMTRRSLASFMNAMTYADRTLYPFATTNEQDFFNLMDVYLDTTLFPLLRKEDFLQEGWRLGFNDDNQLIYQGVVFNEMKGATADPSRLAYVEAAKALLPGTIYAVDSGGIPADIPNLTHEALVDFHHQFYHPSRAVVMTYGNVAVEKVQAKLLETLARGAWNEPLPPLERANSTLAQPTLARARLPSEDGKQGVLLGWLLGDTYANDMDLIMPFMEQVLIGNEAAPVMAAISQLEEGRPGPLQGGDNNYRQTWMAFSVDGLTPGNTTEATDAILGALKDVAVGNLPKENLEGVWRDFGISLLERGGQMPHGLDLMLRMAPAVLEGHAAAHVLDLAARLEGLRERLTDPAYIGQWVQVNLLDNPRALTLHMDGDTDYFQALEQKEREVLMAIEDTLSGQEKDGIRHINAELDAAQRLVSDVDVLPNISISVVSRSPLVLPEVSYEAGTAQTPGHMHVEVLTEGVQYLTLMADTSSLETDARLETQLLMDILPRMGTGKRDWEEAMAWRHRWGQGVNTGLAAGTLLTQEGLTVRAGFSAKNLDHESHALTDMLLETALAPKLNDTERLRFLVRSSVESNLHNLSQLAPGLANEQSVRWLGREFAFAADTGGLKMLELMQRLQMEIENGNVDHLVERLQQRHAWLMQQPMEVRSFGGAKARAAGERLQGLLHGRAGIQAPTQAAPEILHGATAPDGDTFLVVPGSVGYCYQTWAAPRAHRDADAPYMELLGHVLRQGFLHRAVREQGGAYGSGANFMPSGAFVMSSYRDPRVGGTFEDFRLATDWAQTQAIRPEAMDEAKRNALQKMDRPKPPRHEATVAAGMATSGVTYQHRTTYRQTLLDAQPQDLQRVAQAWLNAPSVRVAASPETMQSLWPHAQRRMPGALTPAPVVLKMR